MRNKPDRERRRKIVREAVRRIKAQAAEVEVDLSAIDWTRRNRCRLDLYAFCATYLPAMFPLPWSDDQIESIRTIEHVAQHGECYAQAAPRGDGKTQRAKAGALWAALYGHARYIAILGATAHGGKRLVAEIAQELADNDALAHDWPHVCLPVRAAFRRANRAPFVTINGDPIRLEVSASKLALPEWDKAPDGTGGTVIEGGGILAAVRGLRHATADGRTIRPDLLLMDDIQTRRSANSPRQCEERLAVLSGDLKRLAGPGRRLAAVCNVTVIRAGDAADQLLDRDKHPEWHGVRRPMVTAWPAAKDTLWKEYTALRRSGQRDGDHGAAANDFYKAHRAEMDAGAAVSWAHRYVADAGEVSALQHAFNILCDDGEAAFASECQNQPLEMVRSEYEITEGLVLSRLSGMPRLTAPAGATFIVAAADVNFCGLNWTLGAFRKDSTCWIADWGKLPEGRDLIDRRRASGHTEAQAIASAIVELAHRLDRTQVMVDGRPQSPDCLVVDCGFQGEAILACIGALRLPLRVYPVRGRGAAQYMERKDALRRGDRWHFAQWPAGRVLIVDSDYWTEQAQRAFLMPVGTPGACALYGTEAEAHRRLAREIAGNKLVEHVTTAKADLYRWARTPGIPNDLCDALAYMFAAASAAGAGTIAEATPRTASEPPTRTAAPAPATAQPPPLGQAAGGRRQPSRVPSIVPECVRYRDEWRNF